MHDYTFGNFLYTLRSEKGLSQAQLGEMLGVTNKAVSKWENGSAKPNTNLIPQIATIFNITVEELFACKRIESNAEYQRIKQYLATQKKRYAVLSSVFLALLIVSPLLLVEFICVVMGFHLPDDIVGPLGAVGFILLFVISLTAFIIHYKNHKKVLTPSDFSCSPPFVAIIRKGLRFSSIAWLCLFMLLHPIHWMLLSFSLNPLSANIFLAITAFVLIILLSVIIGFATVKRLLKIRLWDHFLAGKKYNPFSQWPMGAKISYIALITLSFVGWHIRDFRVLGDNWQLIQNISAVIWLACWIVFIVSAIKEKRT